MDPSNTDNEPGRGTSAEDTWTDPKDAGCKDVKPDSKEMNKDSKSDSDKDKETKKDPNANVVSKDDDLKPKSSDKGTGAVNCPRCFRFVEPMEDSYPTMKTHVVAGMLFCCLTCCICCPYIFDCCGTKVKRCPKCGYIITRPDKKDPQHEKKKSKSDKQDPEPEKKKSKPDKKEPKPEKAKLKPDKKDSKVEKQESNPNKRSSKSEKTGSKPDKKVTNKA